MSIERHKDTVTRALADLGNPARRERYFDLYAEDAVLHGMPPELPPGLTGVRIFYEALWAAFPDARVTPEALVGEGDQLAVRFWFEGTHQGPFLGLAPTGRRVRVHGINLLRFADGRCVERWRAGEQYALWAELTAPS